MQTEAVAYLAGRSEGAERDAVACAAFAVFLYRRETRGIPGPAWPRCCCCSALALLSKEQTVALPALLLLTDYWWNPGFSLKGIRANWRLYVLLALGAAAGVALFWRLILHAPTSAGFGMKDFTWYQYFFTECRACSSTWALFCCRCNLTVDWDFPISQHHAATTAPFSGWPRCRRCARRPGITAAASRWPATASSCSWC